MVSRVTSKVPPPRSKTRMFFSPPFLSMPYAMAAAVGSLMMRCTVMPVIVPASFIAWRCASLKYAGTVTTACFTSLPKKASAVDRIFVRTMAEISSGAKTFFLPTFKDDLHVGLVVLGHEREGEDLLVRLVLLLVELAADEALHVEDRVLGVDRGLVLRRVADQSFAGVVPRDVGRRDAVALVVRDDLDAAVLEDADARVRRAQINTNHGPEVLLGDGRGRERRRGERGAHHLSLLLLLWVRVCRF